MPRIIGLLVLFLATLTLGGCAGMPLDYGNSAGGYGGSCPQAYGAMTPGYAAAGPAIIYAPQPQPYYAPQPYAYYNGATAYGPAPLPPQADPAARSWIDHRERDQAARIRQGRPDGYEAQRQWSEPGHSRSGAEGRMRADGNFSPQNDRGRLNTRQNRANQDIYGARHNGMGQPGAAGPQRGNGTVGPMGSVRQPRINGGQTPGGMQPPARSLQPGVAPRARGMAEATQGP